jgi:hypothetical protein
MLALDAAGFALPENFKIDIYNNPFIAAISSFNEASVSAISVAVGACPFPRRAEFVLWASWFMFTAIFRSSSRAAINVNLSSTVNGGASRLPAQIK